MSNQRKWGTSINRIHIGDRFGFLTVERKDEVVDNHKVITLRCSHCGALKRVVPGSLLHTPIKTCGKPSCAQAYKTEKARKRAVAAGKRTFTEPLAPGQVFGMLTILETLCEDPETHAVRIKSICECGAIIYALPSALLSGKTKTCGNPECTAIMKLRTRQNKRSNKIIAIEECDTEAAERAFYVQNKLPVKDYIAGCFENLSCKTRE